MGTMMCHVLLETHILSIPIVLKVLAGNRLGACASLLRHRRSVEMIRIDSSIAEMKAFLSPSWTIIRDYLDAPFSPIVYTNTEIPDYEKQHPVYDHFWDGFSGYDHCKAMASAGR